MAKGSRGDDWPDAGGVLKNFLRASCCGSWGC